MKRKSTWIPGEREEMAGANLSKDTGKAPWSFGPNTAMSVGVNGCPPLQGWTGEYSPAECRKLNLGGNTDC